MSYRAFAVEGQREVHRQICQITGLRQTESGNHRQAGYFHNGVSCCRPWSDKLRHSQIVPSPVDGSRQHLSCDHRHFRVVTDALNARDAAFSQLSGGQRVLGLRRQYWVISDTARRRRR